MLFLVFKYGNILLLSPISLPKDSVFLSKFHYIKSSSGILYYAMKKNIPEEILENEVLDRIDIFDFRGEFKKRLAVNLEVFNKCHRAIENFFALCKVTV